MQGVVKPARITGGDSIMEVLEGLIDHAEAVVNSAVGEQIEDQRDRLREQASLHDRWQGLAPDDIDTWEDADGNAAFGVPDESPAAVQAGVAEYGDDANPPTALVRMGVLSQVSDIGWSLDDTFREMGL